MSLEGSELERRDVQVNMVCGIFVHTDALPGNLRPRHLFLRASRFGLGQNLCGSKSTS